jgi:hypothetical protein
MGHGHYGAKLDDPEMRRLRGLMMLEFKLRNNATNAVVAKEFKVAERTVEATFSWMRKAGLIAKAEDKVLQELLPLAHKAIKAALESDDVELASDRAMQIFKGMLPTFGKRSQASTQPGTPAGDLSYIDELRKGELIDGTSIAVEGEVVPSLPPASSAPSEEGDAPAA